MRVSPHNFLKLTKLLNEYKIRHMVQIFDLQTVINRQNDVPSQASSWYSEYHTLDEVFIMRYFPGGVLPYMGYLGMCGPKGYGFSAVLVINRVSILADFGHFGHNLHSSLDIFKKPLFHHYRKENQQRPVTNYVYSNLTLV